MKIKKYIIIYNSANVMSICIIKASYLQYLRLVSVRSLTIFFEILMKISKIGI